MWNSKIQSYYNGKKYNIRSAIDYWYNSDPEKGVSFRDMCSGPHCSDACPEEIILAPNEEKGTWSTGIRIAIAASVILIAVTCLIMKVHSATILYINRSVNTQYLFF